MMALPYRFITDSRVSKQSSSCQPSSQMGKSGGRRKKSTNTATLESTHTSSSPPPPSVSASSVSASNGVILDPSIFLKRAHELKEEGNRLFQLKDYPGALEQYEQALKLIPKSHPDRAVFHSNRAACLMQMKPVAYDNVITECSLALLAQPRFARALLRRARAFEAIGKYQMAMQDAQVILSDDSDNRDALEIVRRLRILLGPRQEAQPDLQSQPSPAALGASAVRGGPCLPARSVPKKPVVTTPPNKNEKPVIPAEFTKQIPKSSLKPQFHPSSDLVKKDLIKHSLSQSQSQSQSQSTVLRSPSSGLFSDSSAARLRPLKLVYGHDIRLAQMPVNCSFKLLREMVSKRFPSSKSVLIKYKDVEGDLVTITCTSELRLAESCVEKKDESEGDKRNSELGVLRLHIVEVSPEQEPLVIEEEEEKIVDQDTTVEDQCAKGDEIVSVSSPNCSIAEGVDKEIIKNNLEIEETQKLKPGNDHNHNDCKEVEIDDWLFDFAQLFRTHVGIDPDAHIDLHELGMELCTEALEETVTSEEAQSLFDMAATKFQEVAALAYFNWGNVYMCAARKRIPLDDSLPTELVATQLKVAYDWVKERYALAGLKYEEALRIKPDFYEGLLALGQQNFENAKLQWSFALANKVDLASWDSLTTFKLFDSAAEKMKEATEMWEKLEAQRASELKDSCSMKKEDLLKRRKKQDQVELSAEESAEQSAVMRSQIHLFWGNMLFERSQVEFKLGIGNWKKNLDDAIGRFKLAGASESDIDVVLKNHSSNVADTDNEKTNIVINGEAAKRNSN